MNDGDRGWSAPSPDEFRKLRERPTPELDSEGLWRRVAAELDERPESEPPWWRRFGFSGDRSEKIAGLPAGVAWGAAAATILAWLGVWSGLVWSPAPSAPPRTGDAGGTVAGGDAPSPYGTSPGVPDAGGPNGASADRDVSAGHLVPFPPVAASPGSEPGAADTGLAPPPDRRPDGADLGGIADEARLSVRLVHGWDGPPPAGMTGSGVGGAGGADELVDIRSRVATLLDYDNYGLVGRWEGSLPEALQQGVELGPDATVSLGTMNVTRHGEALSVELTSLRVDVDGMEISAPQLRLVPGRVYLFGLSDGREPRGPSRLLALRADLPGESPRP